LEFKFHIEEKFDRLTSTQLSKIETTFKTSSAVVFLAAKDYTKFEFFWKSCNNEQFLVLKPFKDKFSEDEKEVWTLAANFLNNSLRTGQLGESEDFCFNS
jgi:hypothetical protein